MLVQNDGRHSRSPKLNGHVERAQRTPTEEFNEVIPDSFPLPILNRPLRAWDRIYNTRCLILRGSSSKARRA